MSTVEKCFTLLLVLLTTALQGQTTEPKRSERYAKAYEKYLLALQFKTAITLVRQATLIMKKRIAHTIVLFHYCMPSPKIS